ncbi:MAG: hypothetical protein ABSC37_04410 [Xanthobacteraceae bacterium]|jgi:hypothetical protein
MTAKIAPRGVFAYVVHEGKVRAPAMAPISSTADRRRRNSPQCARLKRSAARSARRRFLDRLEARLGRTLRPAKRGRLKRADVDKLEK